MIRIRVKPLEADRFFYVTRIPMLIAYVCLAILSGTDFGPPWLARVIFLSIGLWMLGVWMFRLRRARAIEISRSNDDGR